MWQRAQRSSLSRHPIAEPEFQFWFASGDLLSIGDIATRSGLVAVVDGGGDSVEVFTEAGVHQLTLTGPGGQLGSFEHARGVALASNGRIVVTDSSAHRVSVFSAQGLHQTTFGGNGSGPGLFNLPVAAEIRNGKIYVSDAGNHRVQVFSMQGDYVRSIGPAIVGGSDLSEPQGIGVTSDGELAIRHGDSGQFKIVVLNSADEVVREIDTGGSNARLTVDAADRFWTQGGEGFEVRDRDGSYLGVWDPGNSITPIEFDSQRRAVVFSFVNLGRIEVYKFYQCNNRLATYVGTPGDDFVTGSPLDDVAVMRGGDDFFSGGLGRDTICGGPGADTLDGGGGIDRVYGQGGPDLIYGQSAKDFLFGGNGLDTISGGGGPDWIYGGKHADELRGGNGNDSIFGGNGPDGCFGGAGTDVATSCATQASIP